MGSLRTWWSGTKPTDALSVIISLISVGLAGWALRESQLTSDSQTEFQKRSEEQSAPVLAPGTPPQTRGKTIRVSTEYATVEKRADRFFLDRAERRIVIPLRNGGAGIALTVGVPLLVDNCSQPNVLPQRTVGLLGTYLISSGGSDQLGFLQPKSLRPGSVQVGNRSLRYSWDYENFGKRSAPESSLSGTPMARGTACAGRASATKWPGEAGTARSTPSRAIATEPATGPQALSRHRRRSRECARRAHPASHRTL